MDTPQITVPFHSSPKVSGGICDMLDARVSDICLGVSVARLIWDELRERATRGAPDESDEMLFESIDVVEPLSSKPSTVGVGEDDRE